MGKMMLAIAILGLGVLWSSGPADAEWDGNDFRTAALAHLLDAHAMMGEYGTDSAILRHKLYYFVHQNSYGVAEEIIWWDRSGHGVMSSDFIQDYLPGVEVGKVEAFSLAPAANDIPSLQMAEPEALGKDRIKIQQPGGDDAMTNVVVAFDTPVPGEVRGVLIQRRVPASLSWNSWVLAGSLPLVHAEVRVINDKDVASSIFGFRFPEGMMQQEILDKDETHLLDVRVWANNIPPIIHEPYAPDRTRQSPRFAVAWRGTRYDFYGNKLWWYTNDWNQIAGAMAELEQEVMRDNKKARKKAGELVGELPPREAAATLYRFVQTELQRRPSWAFYRDEDMPTADKILKTRAGNSDERAYLLLAMLRGVGIDADLVWAHDPRDGGFVQKYPAWLQLPVPLVRATFGQDDEMWFDLACTTCPAGELRPRMRHTTCLIYDPQCADAYDEAVKYSFVDGERRGRDPFSLFAQAIRTKPWARLEKTPGSNSEVVGFQSENLVLTLNAEGLCDGRLSVLAWGRMEGLMTDDMNPTPGLALVAHAQARYPALPEPEEVETSVDEGDSVQTIILSHEVEVPEPMGSTWILAPELVYGRPFMDPWPEPRRSPFSIGNATIRRTRISIPLPEGWDDVVLPSNANLGFPILRYGVGFKVEDGNLIVAREITERTAFTEKPDELAHIRKEIEKMILQETSPVVLKRRVEP